MQVAKFLKSEMKRYREWNLDSAAIGIAWLDDQVLKVPPRSLTFSFNHLMLHENVHLLSICRC